MKFTSALVSQLDAFIEKCLAAFDVPGAAVALMQDHDVVYAKGFGVRSYATGQPFTADTIQRIASTSKSMSSMLVATHVDDGEFGWDTPAHEVWPDLHLPTDVLTRTVTVKQLMGMGTGIGGNPIELYADLLTPEHFLREMAALPVISPPGSFYYQNEVYALAAYLRSLKHGIAPADLVSTYASEMKTRLFDPMGMTASAVNDDPAQVGANFAVSYGYHLPDGVASRYPLPFAPARTSASSASVCTTLNEMSRYMLTQLNGGVAPGGARVVSAKHLEETWKPQTKVDDATSYGMGWFDASLNGMRWLNHAGSADGFKTDMNLLPEHGLGFLIFTNSESGSALLWTLRTFLLETLGGKTSNAFDVATAAYQQQNEMREQLRASVKSFTVKRAEVEPVLGRYEKAWQVVFEDDMLWLTRASGYKLVLLPRDDGYLIGSTNALSGFGMLVNFIEGDAGTVRMQITNAGQAIDVLQQVGKLD